MKPKLIVNTNRIIAALVRDSASRRLLYHADVEFLGIRFSEHEVQNHRQSIMSKAKINDDVFDRLMAKLTSRMVFLDDELISLHMEEANRIMADIDPDDAPFIAAALAAGADIWTDDRHFTKQNRIKIWKTADLIKFLEG